MLMPTCLLTLMALYMMLYSLMLWLVSFRSIAVVMLTWLGVFCVAQMVFTSDWLLSPGNVSMAVVIAAVTAIVFFALGVRRWYHVDLD